MQRKLLPAAFAILSLFLAFVVLWKGGKSIESTWLLTGVVWIVVLCSLPVTHEGRTPRLAALSLLGFLGWSVLSYVFSQTQNYGLDELLRDGSLGALFLALLPLLQKLDVKERLLHWILSVLSIVTVLAGFVGLAVYTLQPVNRFVGTFFDFRFDTDFWPNAWAEFLLLAWPMLLLWVQPWRSRVRPLRFLVLGFVLGTLLLSYSRGAFLAFAGQTALLLISIAWQRRRELTTRTIGMTAVSALIIPVLGVAVFFGVNALRSQLYDVQSVTEKVTFTAAEGTSSIDERSQFWQQALELSKQKPWFGWGPYSFRFTQPRFQQGILATADHPHNVFLKFAAERGVPAAAFFTLFLLFVFLPAITSIIRDRSSMAAPFLLTAAAGVLAHNLIDYNLQFVAISLPLWVLFAYLVTESPGKKRYALFNDSARFLSFALASLCLVVAVREAPFLITSSMGRHAEAAGNNEEALSHYKDSEGQWYSRDLLMSETSVLIALHRLPEAMETLAKYHRQNPVDARQSTVSGYLNLSLKNPTEALTHFSHAYRSNSQNDASILRGLLLSLDALKRPAESRAWEEQIMTSLELFAKAIKDNTHFIALSRNVEETEQAIDLAKRVYPWRGPELAALRALVVKESAEERSRLSARDTGILW